MRKKCEWVYPNQKLGTDLLAWIREIEDGGVGSE